MAGLIAMVIVVEESLGKFLDGGFDRRWIEKGDISKLR